MDLLRITHDDFTLTVESTQFQRMWDKGVRILGEDKLLTRQSRSRSILSLQSYSSWSCSPAEPHCASNLLQMYKTFAFQSSCNLTYTPKRIPTQKNLRRDFLFVCVLQLLLWVATVGLELLRFRRLILFGFPRQRVCTMISFFR